MKNWMENLLMVFQPTGRNELLDELTVKKKI